MSAFVANLMSINGAQVMDFFQAHRRMHMPDADPRFMRWGLSVLALDTARIWAKLCAGVVDQRDGFEVGLAPCESSIDPFVHSSLSPTAGLLSAASQGLTS